MKSKQRASGKRSGSAPTGTFSNGLIDINSQLGVPTLLARFDERVGIFRGYRCWLLKVALVPSNLVMWMVNGSA